MDFLQNFKSSSTEAVEQLESLNINGDGDSDEYDMVDDSDDPAPGASQSRSKVKYMQMLQDVADRERTDIIIDLNDLESWERANTDDEHNYKLIQSIERNAHHYIELFSRAVDKVMPQPSRELKYVFPILPSTPKY